MNYASALEFSLSDSHELNIRVLKSIEDVQLYMIGVCSGMGIVVQCESWYMRDLIKEIELSYNCICDYVKTEWAIILPRDISYNFIYQSEDEFMKP